MKTKIIELRSEGKTYKDISLLLGVSPTTVAYYCAPNRKEQVTRWCSKYNKNNRLCKKVATFHGITKQKVPKSFTYRDFLTKIGNDPKCYLTGTPIYLSDIKSYSIDHVIPVSRGGNNSIENAELIRTDVNKMKQDKTNEQLFELCKLVLENNGYLISKQFPQQADLTLGESKT